MNDIFSSFSAMADMQAKINSVVNSPAIQAIKEYQNKIYEIANPPAIRQIKMAQEALDGIAKPLSLNMSSLNTAAALSVKSPYLAYQQNLTESLSAVGKSYLDSISTLNNRLQNVGVFAGIASLRATMPGSFAYEHNDQKFYDDEVYTKIFTNGNEWSVKIEEDNLSVTYKNGDLEISGTEIREVVAVKQLFPELEKKQIIGFINYLKKFPFLALSDKKGIGTRILDALKEKAINYTFVLDKGTLVYRARELSKKKAIYFIDEEMLEPDNGIPNIGRFNPYGVSLLYVSEDSETAKKELGKQKYQVAEISVNKPLHILDLEKSGGLLYKYCNLKKSSKNYNPEEYMLSNFLGQCGCYLKTYCDIELDGFKYESTKNKGKYCYVLFEVHTPNILVNEICYETLENQKK